jgi:uncharacterized protein (DUF2164 family)
MKITVNIPDGVLDRMKELEITDESIQEDMIMEFINDALESHYFNGMSEKFRKWTFKKDNIEYFLERSK